MYACVCICASMCVIVRPFYGIFAQELDWGRQLLSRGSRLYKTLKWYVVCMGVGVGSGVGVGVVCVQCGVCGVCVCGCDCWVAIYTCTYMPVLHTTLNFSNNTIIESVDSISRDEPDSPFMQYITNAEISRARYTSTLFKHNHRVLRLISNRISAI